MPPLVGTVLGGRGIGRRGGFRKPHQQCLSDLSRGEACETRETSREHWGKPGSRGYAPGTEVRRSPCAR